MHSYMMLYLFRDSKILKTDKIQISKMKSKLINETLIEPPFISTSVWRPENNYLE